MNRRGPWESSWAGATDGGRGAGPPWGGGAPPWMSGLFGLAQAGSTKKAKVRRGDVRTAILDVLAVEPMNGYQIIQQIAERSGGLWKPSPGSVYPNVQQLEDEGLVESAEIEGRRTLRLSEAGERYVADNPDELAATWRPFEQESEAEDSRADLKPVVGQVMAAVWQVMTSGSQQQQADAAEILADTRRRLYGLLADGDPEA